MIGLLDGSDRVVQISFRPKAILDKTISAIQSFSIQERYILDRL